MSSLLIKNKLMEPTLPKVTKARKTNVNMLKNVIVCATEAPFIPHIRIKVKLNIKVAANPIIVAFKLMSILFAATK